MTVRNVAYPPALMNRDEAAYYVHVSTRKFNDLIQRNDVTAIRHDGQKLYRRADLDEYIARLPEWEAVS